MNESFRCDRRLSAEDAPVREATRALAVQHPGDRYLRLQIFLRQRDFKLGWLTAHRLCRQGGLVIPEKQPERARGLVGSGR